MKFRLPSLNATTYFTSTLSYGFIRKAIELHNTTVVHYDLDSRKEIRIPVLLSDKLLLTALATIAAPTLWPFYR